MLRSNTTVGVGFSNISHSDYRLLIRGDHDHIRGMYSTRRALWSNKVDASISNSKKFVQARDASAHYLKRVNEMWVFWTLCIQGCLHPLVIRDYKIPSKTYPKSAACSTGIITEREYRTPAEALKWRNNPSCSATCGFCVNGRGMLLVQATQTKGRDMFIYLRCCHDTLTSDPTREPTHVQCFSFHWFGSTVSVVYQRGTSDLLLLWCEGRGSDANG